MTKIEDIGEFGLIKIITRKPIIAQEDELKQNPRSRSAKLRIFEMRL